MEELVIAGKQYVSSRRASQMTGYTKDYIGQMCRAGKIDSKLVGRNWYVEPRALLHISSISTKKITKKTVSSQPPAVKEYKVAERALNEGSFVYEPENVSYEADSRPLVPELRQVSDSIAVAGGVQDTLPEGDSNEPTETTQKEEEELPIRTTVKSKPSANAVDLRLAGLAAKGVQTRVERRREVERVTEKVASTARFKVGDRKPGGNSKVKIIGTGLVVASVTLAIFGMMGAKEVVYPADGVKYSFSTERFTASVASGLINLVSTR